MIRKAMAVLAFSVMLPVVAACGSSGGKAASSSGNAGAGTSTNQVAIRNFAFVPQTITVKAGTTVTWTNYDNVQHSVQWDNNVFPTSPLMLAGSSVTKYSHTFTRAGTYKYACGVHVYMTGTVIVTP